MSNSRRLRRMMQNARVSEFPSELGQHLDCGCHTRHIKPVEKTISCPACGRPSDMLSEEGMPWPTSADPGTLITLETSCTCPAGEYEVLFEVLH